MVCDLVALPTTIASHIGHLHPPSKATIRSKSCARHGKRHLGHADGSAVIRFPASHSYHSGYKVLAFEPKCEYYSFYQQGGEVLLMHYMRPHLLLCNTGCGRDSSRNLAAWLAPVRHRRCRGSPPRPRPLPCTDACRAPQSARGIHRLGTAGGSG